MPSSLAMSDSSQSRDELGANDVSHVTRRRLASRAMVPLIACALGLVPGAALAQTGDTGGTAPTTTTPSTTAPGTGTTETREPWIPALTNAPSPFKANRLASKPLGLTPDQVRDAFTYPGKPVELRWTGVPGAIEYEVEIASNPGFSRIMWRDTTDQTTVVPEALLPDGTYWWRVTAIDKAKTRGLPSDSARFVKTWPNSISGLETRAEVGKAPVSFTRLNPYMTWTPVGGAKEYEVQIAAAGQFGTPQWAIDHAHTAFFTPGAFGALADDGYQWRVRAKDPSDHPGPWVTSSAFTKAWERAEAVSPADGAASEGVFLTWNPVAGADHYEVQITQCQFTWVGACLKVSTETTSTGFAPTDGERAGKSLTYGDYWWRVRPVIDGVYGGWSFARKATWTTSSSTETATNLTSTGDTDSALMPHLRWNTVQGALVYRVDIAADANFNQILESVCTNMNAWAPRKQLPDNQIGTGYHWRVVWGAGDKCDEPAYMVDEDAVPTAMFRKQTKVVTAQSADGLVSEEPVISWSHVPGVGKYEIQVAKDARFSEDVRKGTVFGLAAKPGTMFPNDTTLPEGTWYWRVRPIDGGGQGTTWSDTRSFTLTRARPELSGPKDGETVLLSPTLRWTAVPHVCGYQVQLRSDRNFEQQVEPDAKAPGETSGSTGAAPTPDASSSSDIFTTYQTAWTPTGDVVSVPGTFYWRVRADYCDKKFGQWTPIRSFRSIRPPDFNLNTIPTKLSYGNRLTVAGRLELNAKPVKKQQLYVERRLMTDEDYLVYGTVKTDSRGRFAFSLPMRRSASWRLVWRETAATTPVGGKSANALQVASDTGIKGQAPFAVTVVPRVTLQLSSSRVVRKRTLKVRGSVFPRRPAELQVLTSSGWETIKKITPKRTRFGMNVRAKLDPGRYQVRLLVREDKRKRLGTGESRRAGVLVYDKFVIRGGR